MLCPDQQIFFASPPVNIPGAGCGWIFAPRRPMPECPRPPQCEHGSALPCPSGPAAMGIYIFWKRGHVLFRGQICKSSLRPLAHCGMLGRLIHPWAPPPYNNVPMLMAPVPPLPRRGGGQVGVQKRASALGALSLPAAALPSPRGLFTRRRGDKWG